MIEISSDLPIIVEMHVVKLPKYVAREDCIVSYVN